MKADNTTTELRRGIRIDLIIAVSALLISSLATAASWWQSRVVAQQLSSQVWPYLSISTTYDPQYVAVDVVNDGLGPAIIHSVVLTVDGKPYANPSRAFRLVFRPPKRSSFGSQTSGLSPGSVIRASGSTRIFRINAPWAARQFGAAAPRFDLRVCYCSLLGNCWLISARQQTSEPRPMATCPDAGADQYRVGIGQGL
jgi:hypothetical protein